MAPDFPDSPDPRPATRYASVPALATWLLRALVRGPHREFLLGDLEEQHHALLASRGRHHARRWYWSQVLRSLRPARSIRATRPAPSTSWSQTMPHLWGDLRLATRSLRRAPGYSLISVLTLALAIGATTLLFSIANPLLVRALPVQNPDTLGWIMMSHPERGVTRSRSSVPDFLEWRTMARSFDALAAYGVRQGTLTGRGDAARIFVALATPDLAAVWGLTPVIGRFFEPGEDQVGRQKTGLLSFRYWREAYQGDAGVLGTTVFVDGEPVTIVGVMPRKIELGNLSLIDVWTPLTADRSAPRDVRWVLPVGRLSPGATIGSANAELQTIYAGQQRAHPEALDGWTVGVNETRRALASDDTWIVLALLAIVVLFVLLIACANLANLVVARLIGRRQEIDIRLALGASRWRVVRPLLVEGFALSACGGVGGLAIAYGGLRAINAVAFEAFLRDVGIDGNVLIFVAAISVATPLLFALWPALSAGRTLSGSTSHGARAGTGRSAARRRNLLVGIEVALAVALLVVSSLAVQSMLFMRNTDLGFNPRPLLTWRFSLPVSRYPDAPSRARFAADLTARLAAEPGVMGAAVASHLPVLDDEQSRSLSGTFHDGDAVGDRPWASWFAVSEGFFGTLGIPAVAGRTFAASDRAGAEPVAILGRMAADRYFDGVDAALGRQITIHDARSGDRSVRVVGVVADTRDNQLLRTSPQIYVPIDQFPQEEPVAIVRAADPLAAAPAARVIMRGLDRDVAAFDMQPLSKTISDGLSSNAIINGLFVGFAVLALVLASAGLFGVISYSVGQRRREIGVRMALGARPSAVARMILGDGLKLTAAGAVAGVLIALALSRVAAPILFGVSPTDAPTFIGATAVVFAVALAASLYPARSAMRIDPARTLGAD